MFGRLTLTRTNTRVLEVGWREELSKTIQVVLLVAVVIVVGVAASHHKQ